VAHPPRREGRRADEGGYIYASPLSRALDDIQIHRSAPLPTSSSLPEDIPLPSVERDSEPSIVPKLFEKAPKARDYETRLVPVDRRGLDEAHSRSPQWAPLGPSRDIRGDMPDVSYRYSRPTAYVDRVPPQPAQVSMPHKVPTREFVRAHDSSRQNNEQIFIDLTSPLRHSDRNKRYYVPASASSFGSVPSTISNAYEPRRGFDIYAPEHRSVIVSNPREGDIYPRRVHSGYVESDSMGITRGDLPGYGRRPY
jgi:hypothetical protein